MTEVGDDTCRNCGARLTDAYCSSCGQKRFTDHDRRFGHLLHQFLASATDLDGRVWRTLRALMLQPGLLSREYFDGRRTRWIAPISLFLAINVIYFLAPLHGGDLALQFDQQVPGRLRVAAADPGTAFADDVLDRTGQMHTPYTIGWMEARVAARDAAARRASKGAKGYSWRDYRLAYDARADDVSKALIILHLPLTALVLLGLLLRTRRYFAEHFVFTLHFFAFALVALQILVQSASAAQALLPNDWAPSNSALDWLVRLLLPSYATLALRRAYSLGWIASLGTAIAMIAGIVGINLYVYRTIDFLVTFALT